MCCYVCVDREKRGAASPKTKYTDLVLADYSFNNLRMFYIVTGGKNGSTSANVNAGLSETSR